MAMRYLQLQQVLTLYEVEMVVAYHITSHKVKVRTAAGSPRLQPHEHHKGSMEDCPTSVTMCC